jgi:hypothetical protein
LTQEISTGSVGVFMLLCVAEVTSATAQQRGQYLSGIYAVNSGVQPDLLNSRYGVNAIGFTG